MCVFHMYVASLSLALSITQKVGPESVRAMVEKEEATPEKERMVMRAKKKRWKNVKARKRIMEKMKMRRKNRPKTRPRPR